MTSVFCRECGGWMVNSEENLTIWICELCGIEIELDIEEERKRLKDEDIDWIDRGCIENYSHKSK